jgi:hypothetical protein
MDYSDINSLLGDLEIKTAPLKEKPIHKPLSMDGRNTIKPLNGQNTQLARNSNNSTINAKNKSLREQTNKRISDYNQNFNARASHDMVVNDGTRDFKSFMDNIGPDCGYKDDDDSIDLNERLAQRDLMLPMNSGSNHVFDNLPIMTREVSDKKNKK